MSLAKKLSTSFPWVSSPFIVGAPMRVMAGPALAVAVSSAGGLGFIGPSIKTQDVAIDLEKAANLVKQARTSQNHVFHSLSKNHLLPVGIGFQLWSDDADIAVSAISKFKPCAVWLFAPRNGQQELDHWSKQIRKVSPLTQVWIQIGTLLEAKELLKSKERPDVIVVQGTEAGGHGRAHDGLSLVTLLPEIADAAFESGIPLFAAGGIADGRGAAAALCLGASGVVMGTRFLAATETRISKGYQQAVINATDGASNTVRTTLYNQLRGTVGWPDEYSPRTIINKSWFEYQAGTEFEVLKKLHDKALKTGDDGWGSEGRLATYAGASVGLVHDVKDAAVIVRETREGVFKALKCLESNSRQEF